MFQKKHFQPCLWLKIINNSESVKMVRKMLCGIVCTNSDVYIVLRKKIQDSTSVVPLKTQNLTTAILKKPG